MRLKNILAVAAFLCLNILWMFECSGRESAHKERTPIEKARMQPVIEEDVYICTGSSARKYHKWKGCRGLNKCRGVIKKMSIQNARRLGREPCKMCH